MLCHRRRETLVVSLYRIFSIFVYPLFRSEKFFDFLDLSELYHAVRRYMKICVQRSQGNHGCAHSASQCSCFDARDWVYLPLHVRLHLIDDSWTNARAILFDPYHSFVAKDQRDCRMQ